MEKMMQLNIPAIKKLIDEKYRGNQAFFADEIGTSRTYLNLILNGRRNPNSSKACAHIITYCEKNNMNYKDLIILP